jgi:hypothetical protein
MIDFDNVYLGDAAEDVAYALRMFVGYGFAAGEPVELVRRTRVALTAYGGTFDVPTILEREYDLPEERCRRNGWHRQLAKLPTERASVSGEPRPARRRTLGPVSSGGVSRAGINPSQRVGQERSRQTDGDRIRRAVRRTRTQRA